MPVVIVTFFVACLFDRRPCDPVRNFVTIGIITTILRSFILLIGAVEGFFIDILGVFWQYTFY